MNIMVTTEGALTKMVSKEELLDPTEKKLFEEEDEDMSKVPLALAASDGAAAIAELYKQKITGIDDGYPQLLWEAMASFCEEHPNCLVMMINRPIFVHARDRVTFGGIAVLLDVMPALDPSLRMKVLKVGFMEQLAHHTVQKHQTPKGREKLCMMLYAGFQAFKRKHLDCETCCPTPESRARARRELFDSSTATILSNTCCGTDRYDKIILASLFWPDCLPEHLRDGTFDWLGDPAERVRVTKEIVGEPAARTDSSDSETIRCIDGVLDFDELQRIVTGGDQANPQYNMLKEAIEGLAQDEFFFTVRYSCGDRGEARLILRKDKFQRPAVIVKPSGCATGYHFKIDLKKCAYCDKEEEVSRTYGQCQRCESVYYCCREHQVEHWPHHKKICKK